MKKLRRRKKMLTMLAFLYCAILAVAVTYAAATGLIIISGTAITSADLHVIIDDLSIRYTGGTLGAADTYFPPPGETVFGSRVTSVVVGDDGQSMTISVDLRAPGDSVSVSWEFVNDGNLPAEFEEVEIEIDGIFDIDEDPNSPNYGNRIRVYNNVDDPTAGYTYRMSFPIIIEDLEAPYIIGAAESLSGETIQRLGRMRAGLQFTWDEDNHHITHPEGPTDPDGEPITFTIRFPFVIGEWVDPTAPVDPPVDPPVTP